MNKIKIGFLPLYLKLYDECCPELRLPVEAFAATIREEYEKRDIEVIAAPPCCLKSEFAEAVKNFETSQVDAILTLHLAYSPSLESADILARTDLPIVILDTTPDFEFGFEQNTEAIMFNHGIHGVQDMCNLLIRNGKKFMIEAGHWHKSDVIERTLLHLKACKIASSMHKARVGIIGEPFAGMGDFAIPFETLKADIGIEVIAATSEDIAKLMPAFDSRSVKNEIEADINNFKKGNFTNNALVLSEAAGLGVRRWLEQENLTALTINFLDIKGLPGLPVMPFLETSKAMSRGIGYAGEGDVLTAALCGSIAQTLLETTFTEMFCPDWEKNRIFMSHMGEINPDLCAGKAVLQEKPFPFTEADNPVVATGCLKAGKGCLINIAPGPDKTYTLLGTAVKICDPKGNETIKDAIRGWIEPAMPIAEFLPAYSKLGGTHHSILAYNCDLELISRIADIMGWQSTTIPKLEQQVESFPA